MLPSQARKSKVGLPFKTAQQDTRRVSYAIGSKQKGGPNVRFSLDQGMDLHRVGRSLNSKGHGSKSEYSISIKKLPPLKSNTVERRSRSLGTRDPKTNRYEDSNRSSSSQKASRTHSIDLVQDEIVTPNPFKQFERRALAISKEGFIDSKLGNLATISRELVHGDIISANSSNLLRPSAASSREYFIQGGGLVSVNSSRQFIRRPSITYSKEFIQEELSSGLLRPAAISREFGTGGLVPIDSSKQFVQRPVATNSKEFIHGDLIATNSSNLLRPSATSSREFVQGGIVPTNSSKQFLQRPLATISRELNRKSLDPINSKQIDSVVTNSKQVTKEELTITTDSQGKNAATNSRQIFKRAAMDINSKHVNRKGPVTEDKVELEAKQVGGNRQELKSTFNQSLQQGDNQKSEHEAQKGENEKEDFEQLKGEKLEEVNRNQEDVTKLKQEAESKLGFSEHRGEINQEADHKKELEIVKSSQQVKLIRQEKIESSQKENAESHQEQRELEVKRDASKEEDLRSKQPAEEATNQQLEVNQKTTLGNKQSDTVQKKEKKRSRKQREGEKPSKSDNHEGVFSQQQDATKKQGRSIKKINVPGPNQYGTTTNNHHQQQELDMSQHQTGTATNNHQQQKVMSGPSQHGMATTNHHQQQKLDVIGHHQQQKFDVPGLSQHGTATSQQIMDKRLELEANFDRMLRIKNKYKLINQTPNQNSQNLLTVPTEFDSHPDKVSKNIKRRRDLKAKQIDSTQKQEMESTLGSNQHRDPLTLWQLIHQQRVKKLQLNPGMLYTG